MCPSKIALHFFLFFSDSSRWLGAVLLSWALGSTPHFMDFWWDWFHGFRCVCWLVSLRWFDMTWCHASILGCWDWTGKVEKGSWYSIQARCELSNYCNCRSEKTDKQIDLLSYSLSWASPSLTRHDIPLPDQVPCPSWNFVQLSTVALLHGSFKNWDLLTMGFEHWALGMV